MPVQNRALKPDKTTSQDLSAAALSYATDYGRAFHLESIRIHASTGITETITITLDSAKGANYDHVLATIELSSEQDFIYVPDDDANYQAGDEIKIQCTNANTTGTVYVTVKASELTR